MCAWKTVTPSFAGDSQHFGGDDGLNKYSNLFNGVLDVDTVDINSGWTFRSGKPKFRNPANTFSYTIVSAAIIGDRILNLPLCTTTDTLAALNVVQTFTAVQTFDTYSDIKQIAVPGSPASTYHRLYVDSADSHLKRKNSSGTVFDYDASVSGGEVNTASNVGTAGVGVFKVKSTFDLQFKKINTTNSAYITITDDTGNSELDIGLGTSVATLNTGQTFTSAKAFDLHTDLKQIASPANPAATYHRIYVDSADSHLKRKDSAGGIKDYDTSSGGSGGTNVSTVYDTFPSTYTVTTDDTLTPNSLWRVIYRGTHPLIYAVGKPYFGTDGDSSTNMGAGAVTRYGIQLNGSTGELVGMALTSFTVRLKKTGTPTGNLTATVRDAADTVVATFTETPAATSLTTSFTSVVFTLASPYTLANTDRILLEYGGTVNTVQIEVFSTDQFNAGITRRTSFNAGTGLYTEATGTDICGTLGITDPGIVGVRVPAGSAFPRVMYMYPCTNTIRTDDALNPNGYEGTSSSLVLTEGNYYSDFDIILSVRTVTQRRSTPATANAWESTWIFFRFNEAEGTNFHHYYLVLKTDGTLELGRKDNSTSAEEQTFLSTGVTYSWTLNTWNKVRISAIANRIQVFIDDVPKIDVLDNGSVGTHVDSILGTIPTLPPSTFMYQGKIGLYNEDAEVEFSPMTITTTGGLVQAYNYLVYKSGTIYTAQNGVSNALEFTGTDLKTVLNQIETAIPQGGYVRFAPGDFSLASQWTPTQSNIIWAGSGIDVTRILFDMGSTGAGIKYTGSLGTFNNLTANTLKGAKAVTIASTSGFLANDWVYIRRAVNTQSGITTTAYDAEIHRIATVTSGTVLTLDIPLYEDYLTSATSSVAKITWCNSVTFRDMTIYDNRASVTVLAEQGDVYFGFCRNLMLENIKLENMVFSSLTPQSCFNVSLNNVQYESPRTTSSSSTLRYGLHCIGATTNMTINGGYGNRCRHTIDFDVESETPIGTLGGRPRNILVQGVKSYDADSIHFNTHQGVVGITFVDCGAIGGHTATETSPDGEQPGFSSRSPATFIGCYTQGAFAVAMTLQSDDGANPVGTDQYPQCDRTIVNGCRFENVVSDTNPLARGIRIGVNRGGILITNCSFHNIANEVIDIRAGASNINISNNIFSSCAGSQGSGGGYIRVLTTASDLIIKGNTFDAGTPSAAGRPLWIGTSVAGLKFIYNDVNGLTNKMPTVPAASTDITIMENIGLNPIGRVTNPVNATSSTIGSFGGTTSTVAPSIDYTITGGTMIVFVSSGTGVSMTIKDGSGNILDSGVSTGSQRTLPKGYRINFGAFSVAPTVLVGAY